MIAFENPIRINQTLIEIFSADLALKIFIAITIAIENLIRIDRDPILTLKSISDFRIKIDPAVFILKSICD